MAYSRAPHKKDSVSSDSFAGLSTGAKAKVCHGAIRREGGARFCLEVIAGEWAGSAFEQNRGLGYSDLPSLASEALSMGSPSTLALARLLFARAKATRPSKTNWQRGFPFGRMEATGALIQLYSGQAGDEKAWRARPWILSALRARPDTAAELESEAALAFAHGRPSLGEKLLRLLAAHPAAEIAESRKDEVASLDELPKTSAPIKAPPLEFPTRACNPKEWSKALGKLRVDEDNWGGARELAPNDLASRPALALARMWSGLLRSSDQPRASLLAEGLDEVADKLWKLGAPTSPSDYARRFQLEPLSPKALQIKALSKLGAWDQGRKLLPLWSMAAAFPRRPCGGAILWDAFVAAHQGQAAGVDANPFAQCAPGQTAAMWSLSTGPDLIALGLQRGFDPKPTSRILARPGFMGAVAGDKSRLAPEAQGKESSPFPRGCGIQGLHCAGLARGAPPKAGSADKSKWLRTNLATLALAAGQPLAAASLMRAGCETPDPELPLSEMAAGRGGRQEIDNLRAEWEAFCLRASLDGESKPKAGKGKAKAPEPVAAPEPPAPKRRILKA